MSLFDVQNNFIIFQCKWPYGPFVLNKLIDNVRETPENLVFRVPVGFRCWFISNVTLKS